MVPFIKQLVEFTDFLKIGKFHTQNRLNKIRLDSQLLECDTNHQKLHNSLSLRSPRQFQPFLVTNDQSFKWWPGRKCINLSSPWWFQNLWCHAQAKAIVVAVVWSVRRQLEGGQLRMRIVDVDMVNPSSSNVSRTSDKLLEAKVIESSWEKTVGMLVKADVHVSGDGCHSLHVDQLLQVVH